MSDFVNGNCGMDDPSFLAEKHAEYIKKISNDNESFEFIMTQNIRMSGVYWGLTALSLLNKDLRIELNTLNIVDWVLSCQHPSGG